VKVERLCKKKSVAEENIYFTSRE